MEKSEDDDMVVAAIRIHVRDGETEEVAEARTLRELGLPPQRGCRFDSISDARRAVPEGDLILVIDKRPRFPLIGTRRPPGWRARWG